MVQNRTIVAGGMRGRPGPRSLAGPSDLLNPAVRRLVAGMRYGGMAMAVIGLVLQWFW